MFAQLSEVKTYLSISTPTEDVKLQALLDMSNQFVADYTGVNTFQIQEETVTVTDYWPEPNNRMIIDEDNIASIDKVSINGVETDVTAAIIRGYMVVFSREIKGTITLICRYSTTPETEKGLQALKVAVIELVKFYHKQEYKQSMQAGGESIRFDSVSYIPSHVKAILDLYRK